MFGDEARDHCIRVAERQNARKFRGVKDCRSANTICNPVTLAPIRTNRIGVIRCLRKLAGGFARVDQFLEGNFGFLGAYYDPSRPVPRSGAEKVGVAHLSELDCSCTHRPQLNSCLFFHLSFKQSIMSSNTNGSQIVDCPFRLCSGNPWCPLTV